jgi:hypothetical protein
MKSTNDQGLNSHWMELGSALSLSAEREAYGCSSIRASSLCMVVGVLFCSWAETGCMRGWGNKKALGIVFGIQLIDSPESTDSRLIPQGSRGIQRFFSRGFCSIE